MSNRSPASGSASKRPQLDSNNGDTSTSNDCPAVPPSTQQRTVQNHSRPVTLSPSQRVTDPSSVGVRYTVFISHAGEDKATIAIPLREKLSAKGINAFVDEADMPCGTDAIQAMTFAMETAKIGVIILSPEFIAKKWPMRELMHFLKRREECSHDAHSGLEAPTIIPCFYRLSVGDLYEEPKLSRKNENGDLLYEETRFFDRLKNGEPEADLKKIEVALKSLHNIMGVRNDDQANNSTSSEMIHKRQLLLTDLCNEICKHVPENMRTHTARDVAGRKKHASPRVDSFRPSFPPKLSGTRAVLDFDSRTLEGDPTTPEGQVKRYLVEEEREPASIVSVCGLGGVGKSTIVEVLISDDEMRQRFKDGVYLIRLGSDATNSTMLECIYSILEVSGAEETVQSLRERNNIEEVLGFFLTWFKGKRCMFFIDDIWERSVNVRELSRVCDIVKVEGGNRVLLTTRERDIACLKLDARVVSLSPRESGGEIARKMLFFHAAFAENAVVVADGADPMSKILDICAGLPVSIAVAGKNIRKLRLEDQESGVSVWARYLARLQTSHQTLLLQNLGSYGNLYATLAASLTFLDERSPEERFGMKFKFSFAEMHRRLCVLQKQASVPNTMLMHLWETKSKESAEMIAEVFAEAGLGGHERVESESECERLFSLHDSVHDFAVTEARRHGEVAKTHDLLLEGYGSGHEDVPCELEDKNVKWWSQELQDDGYVHKQLCRHLIESGRVRELCKLLLTPLWTERQVEVNGILRLKDDFEIGMKEMKDDEETREALNLISSAIILSSGILMKNISELWFQIHGRLIRCLKGNMVLEKYVKQMETDAEKPRVLSVNGGLVGAGGRNTKIISVGHGGVRCMSLFPDEERVACGCSDGSVVVVDIRRNAIEREWQAYEGKGVRDLTSIGVSHNGTRIVTMSRYVDTSGSAYTDSVSSEDKVSSEGEGTTLDAWNVESGNEARRIASHDNMGCFAITRDGTCVVCVSKEGSLGWLDIRSGTTREVKLVSSINVNEKPEGIALLKDGERAIIRYRKGMPKLWNIRTGEEIGQFDGNYRQTRRIAVTPDERRVVFCRSKFVTLVDLENRHQIWSQKLGSVANVAVSKDGRRIVTGHFGGVIRIQDLESGDEDCGPLKHRGVVSGVSFLGNKNLIVSCSGDGTVRVWNAKVGQHETSFKGRRGWVTGVSFTPNGKYTVTRSRDGTLRIWDATSGRMVGDALRGHLDRVNDLAVTADGKFVLSVSNDKTVRVWNFESRDLLHTLEGHKGWVNCVAVTPKGDRAVTGSRDKTVRVWDLGKMDGSHVVLEGHNWAVRRVFVSDDGLRVISIDWNNRILVWSMETKEVMKTDEFDDAKKLSRSVLFNLIGEDTVHGDAGLSIRRLSRQIIYGKGSEARVLATLDSEILSWDLSPDRRTICLGLEDGQVAFLKFDV